MTEDLCDGVGLDVGSTTVKVLAVKAGRVAYGGYLRHRGRCLETATTMLAEVEAATGVAGPRFVTGSVGAGLAETLRASYVHEVHAVATAVRARFPRARTVIELGGQDAKMVHIEGGSGGTALGSPSCDMNERCAAGTGATLDRCLYRLGLSETMLRTLTLDDEELPTVSAKCGVFAEADLVSLAKAGVPKERVLLALLDAIVRGNLAVLARGRPLPPGVVLLGGPHAFVPALASLWRRHLEERWKGFGVAGGALNDVVVPADAALFAAEGALRSARALERIREAQAGGREARVPRRLSLASPAALRKPARGLSLVGESIEEPAPLPTRSRPEPARNGLLSLGIDAGSTTIKAVVLDEHDVVVFSTYRRAQDGPFEDAQAVLEAVASGLGSSADRVAALGVTGYAADVLGPVLGADASPVETLAHARSAFHFVPEAEVVCDIGGQDIKVLLLDGGAVTRFHLSNQCAAGNGALLETTAHDLGIALEDYAELALRARRVPVFSVGCAVFLDTERITCQRDGYTPEEILAGMAAVLPRNVWENVVAAPSLASLGRVFVLSGGVQRNRAAVKAQRDYILERHPRARVVVHPYPAEAGAIGAAVAARDAVAGKRTSFVGFERALALRFTTRNDASTRCRKCPSACPRTYVSAARPGGESVRFVTGYACERGASADDEVAARPEPSGARNLLRIEAARLFTTASCAPVSEAGRDLRIAMPRVLALYRSAPFFLHYFAAIGVARDRIVIGEATSEALWKRAAGRGSVDACFPVKVVQAHVADLLRRRAERPFDVLFFPVLTHAITAVRGCADTASCPVVAGTPLVTRAAFGCDGDGRIPGGPLFLTPTLSLLEPERFSAQLFEAMRAVAPLLSLGEHERAVEIGRRGQRAFEGQLEDDGAEALERARGDRRAAIVMLARPYHVDPWIHHDIGSELWALGRTTLSLRALPKSEARLAALGCPMSVDLGGEAPSLTNSGDGEKLIAGRIVAAHPYLVAVEVSSFKCGQDASLYGAVADLVRTGGKPFLALHDLDETRPVSSLRLRLRTFLDAIERYESRLGAAQPSAMGAVS